MNDLLATLANIITITGWSLSVVLIALWEKVLRRLFYRWKYRKSKVANSYILIVGIKKNIENMKAKIANQTDNSLPKLKGLPMEVIELPDNCNVATPTEMIAKLEGLRDNMAKAQKFNVHLFYAGPVALTAFIGGFFYNKDNVYIYHQDFNTKEYECWGAINISK